MSKILSTLPQEGRKMIPGEKKSRKNNEQKIEDSKIWEKIREEHRSRVSATEEKKSDPDKAPLLPTCVNQQIPTSEMLHNLIKSYGYSGDCDDEDYSNTGSGRTPNDDRSDSMNPNNSSYWASVRNHAVQMSRK
ncbi:hypothetical protein [Methanospirillum sp.]